MFFMFALILSFGSHASPVCNLRPVGKPIPLNNSVTKMVYDPGSKNTWIFGAFTEIQGAKRFGVAGLDPKLQLLPQTPRVNGEIVDILQVEDKLFIGGTFSRAGDFAVAGSLVRMTPEGKLDATFPVLAGDIADIEEDGAGGFFIGGSFPDYAHNTYEMLYHLTSDGKLSSISLGANIVSKLSKMTRLGDKLVLVGMIGSYHNTTNILDLKSHSLKPIQTDGWGDTNVIPYKNGFLLLGSFDHVNGVAAKHLAFLDENLKVTGLTINDPYVEVGVVIGDVLYYLNGGTVVAVDLVKNVAIPLPPKMYGTVLKTRNQKLYFKHTYEDGPLIEYDPATQAVKEIPLPFTGYVASFHPTPEGFVFNGNLIPKDGGVAHQTLFLDEHFLPASKSLDVSGTISEVRSTSAGTIIAGKLNSVGGIHSPGLVVFDLKSGEYHPFNFIAWNDNYKISTLKRVGDEVYAGGSFDTFFARTGDLAKVNLKTLVATPNSSYENIFDLVPVGDHLVMSGYITVQNKSCMVGVMDLTSRDVSCQLQGSFADKKWIHKIVAGKEQVYVAGNFDEFGGEKREDIAAFDPRTGHVLPWEVKLPNGNWDYPEVRGIHELDGLTYFSGYFRQDDKYTNMMVFDARTAAPVPLVLDIGLITSELRGDTFLINTWNSGTSDKSTSLVQYKACGH